MANEVTGLIYVQYKADFYMSKNKGDSLVRKTWNIISVIKDGLNKFSNTNKREIKLMIMLLIDSKKLNKNT